MAVWGKKGIYLTKNFVGRHLGRIPGDCFSRPLSGYFKTNRLFGSNRYAHSVANADGTFRPHPCIPKSWTLDMSCQHNIIRYLQYCNLMILHGDIFPFYFWNRAKVCANCMLSIIRMQRTSVSWRIASHQPAKLVLSILSPSEDEVYDSAFLKLSWDWWGWN